MATEIVMPRLSDSMEEGIVLQWLVAEGDTVVEGQPLVEVETDKASVTYESEVDGTVLCAIECDRRVGAALPSSRGDLPWSATPGEAFAAPVAGHAAAALPRHSSDSSRCAGSRRAIGRRQGLPAGAADRRRARGRSRGARRLRSTGRGSSAPTSSVPQPLLHRRGQRRSRGGCGRRRTRAAKGDTTRRPLTRTAADDRPADGRVTRDRAGLRAPRRGRHGRAGRAARAAARARDGAAARPTTTSSSRRSRWRCASSRASTAPTATPSSRSTPASTSGSRLPPRMRSSCRRSSTLTASRSARSRRPRVSLRPRCATARSRRPSSPGARSRSRTWGCSGSTASRRSINAAAGRDPRGRLAAPAPGRRRGRLGRGAPDDQPQPRLRPPDPVRGRRRALPRSGARAARAPDRAAAVAAAG